MLVTSQTLVYSIAVSAVLMTINCSSATLKSETPLPVKNDKRDWKELWKVLKGREATERASINLSFFDTIILANGRANVTEDNGLFLYQGDISLSKTDLHLLRDKRQRKTRAVLKNFGDYRWRRNNLVYELHSSLNMKARKAIEAAIVEWEDALPCLGKWKNINSLVRKPEDYIQFYCGEGCHSPVGRQGGVQKISIGQGCESKVIVIHEIGHTIGMWHEQSRPDRDKYIKILWQNIIPEWRSAFRKISGNFVDSYGVDYDYTSVMHYPESAFAKRAGLRTMISRSGNKRLGNTEGLSSDDIKQARMMYQCK